MATTNYDLAEAKGGMSTLPQGGASMMPPEAMTLNRPSTPAPVSDVTTAPVPATGSSVFDSMRSQLAGAQSRLDALSGATGAAGGATGAATGGEETLGQLIGLSTPLSAQPEPEEFDYEAEQRRAQRNQMRMFQAEIDATNQVYDQLLNEARLEGQGRLGSQRAIAARGGLLGSDFAGAQKQRVQDFNTEQQQLVQAERMAAIGAIMGNVRAAAQNEVAQKRAAREAGATEYLNYLAGKDQRRESNAQLFAQDFLAQSVDPSTLSDEELAEMLSGSGVSKADLIRNYTAAQQGGEEGSEFGFMSTSGGLFRTNPQTGEAEFIASPGASSSGGGSTGASFTATQRNKLEAAGLLNAPRQEQLDHLFGDGADEESATQANTYLQTNRNADPERMRQDLLNEGFSVSMVNSLLETRPMSDVDVSSFAQGLVANTIEPRFWRTRSTELEEAKQNAINELTEDVQNGTLFNLFGERTKQLTQEEFTAIVQEIENLSGRATANELINN